MKGILIVAALLLTAQIPWNGREATAAEDDGEDLFDFEKAEQGDQKKAEEEMEKQGLAADGNLPANVREALDKLTKIQLIEVEIADRRITPLREALKAKLKALGARSTGEGLATALALEKYVTGVSIKEMLRPESAMTDPDGGERWNDMNGKEWNVFRPDGRIKRQWTDGPWRWINRQRTMILVDYWGGSLADVVILPSPGASEAAAFNSEGSRWKIKRHLAPVTMGKRAAGEGLRLLTEAAKAEASIREQSAANTAGRRERVRLWLLEQAKSAPPPAAEKIRMEAASLSAPQGAVRIRERADLFGGVWALPDGRHLEMQPDGKVLLNGKPAGATWDWCKDRNLTTTLVRFGKTDDPSDVWIVRRSERTHGVIRVATRTAYLTAKSESVTLPK